jgi:hypothetical protein
MIHFCNLGQNMFCFIENNNYEIKGSLIFNRDTQERVFKSIT